jgi:hypothetical protein
MRLRRILLVTGLFAALPLGGAVSPSSALTNDQKVKIVEAIKKQSPIEFVTVKGAPGACGPGCDSWIAADGAIDADAASRLRETFDKLGKRKLPIYFNSPGGDLNQGIEIGRMLRARGMTAGVARTLAAKCAPASTVDACAKSLRASPGTEGVLRTDNARCLSACAIAILGATTREIAPDALLGVHSTFVYFKHTPRGANERQLDRAIERSTERLEKTFSGYVAEMKFSKELFNIIWNTKFEDMHYLTRAELFDLGIDRREGVETGWHFGYQPVPAVGSAAFVNLRTESGAADRKPMTLIVSCDSRLTGSFVLTSLQRLPNPSARSAANLRLSAGTFGVTLASASSFLTTYKNETYEVRQLRSARSGIEALIGASTITIAEQTTSETERGKANEPSTAQFTVPGAGTANALKILVAHCTPIQVAVAVPPSASSVFLNVGEAREAAWRFAFLPVASIGSAAFANAPWSRTQMVLAISCGGLSTYTISIVRRLPDPSATARSDIFIGEELLGISLLAAASSAKTWKGDTYDVRQSKWSGSVVAKLLSSPTITVRERPVIAALNAESGKGGEVKPDQYSIPTKGAQEAFKTLSDRCAMLN